MWDTVAWDYRNRRKSPEFSHRKVSISIEDGTALVNCGDEVIEILDGDETIGGIRVIVDRQDHVIFFIVGLVRRKKLTSYTAGVSCEGHLVTSQIMQAATEWITRVVGIPPEDQPHAEVDDAVGIPEHTAREAEFIPSSTPLSNLRIPVPTDEPNRVVWESDSRPWTTGTIRIALEDQGDN